MVYSPAEVRLTSSSELTITARPAPNAPPAALTSAKVLIPSARENLPPFRRAIEQAPALNDKRDFDYFASWHGVPFGWCQHHEPAFPAVAPGLPVLAGTRAPVGSSRRDFTVVGLVEGPSAACASAGGRVGERPGEGAHRGLQYRAQVRLARRGSAARRGTGLSGLAAPVRSAERNGHRPGAPGQAGASGARWLTLALTGRGKVSRRGRYRGDSAGRPAR